MMTESGFFRDAAAAGSLAPAVSSVPPDLAPGRLIADKYELVRKVGVGAMGEVWAAKHLSLDEEVAIKLVLRDVLHEDGSTADGRFLIEARVANQLSRKTRHIVSVTDHGDDGPVAYLVMELLHGESLDVRLGRSGPLPLDKVLPVIHQVARALSVAHGDGIVHRDLKPGNVFVTIDEEGRALVKILDFGIAKINASAEDAPSSSLDAHRNVSSKDAKHATMRGFLLGTPAYMSPEQAQAKPLDHRADVWALAVITYYLLTAQFPFDGESAEQLFGRLIKAEAAPIATYRSDLPHAVSELFATAFAPRIEDRFATADAFSGALHRAAGKRPRTGSNPRAQGISLPPPSRSPASVTSPVGSTVDSKSTAGLPLARKRSLVMAAVLLLAVGAGGGLWVARDRTLPAGLAAGAIDATSSGGQARGSRDDAIPAPAPSSGTATPGADGRAGPRGASTAGRTSEVPAAGNLGAQIATTAAIPPVAPPAARAPAPARAKPADRSEVF